MADHEGPPRGLACVPEGGESPAVVAAVDRKEHAEPPRRDSHPPPPHESSEEDEHKDPQRVRTRRESQLSYGFRLADGRYRPPESEEEWNAFYQECVSVFFFFS
jgi:hypothetical protein